MSSPINGTPAGGGSVYSKSDAAMKQLLDSLGVQTEMMRQYAQTAEEIRADIQRFYSADSSRTFQTKLNDWLNQYVTVMNKYDKLLGDSQLTNQVLNGGEAAALQMGSGWTPGSQNVFNALAH
jgi:hypothetical protein